MVAKMNNGNTWLKIDVSSVRFCQVVCIFQIIYIGEHSPKLPSEIQISPESKLSASCNLFCFVWFDSLPPINDLSVIKGRVFLDWTSSKLGLMFLCKDTKQSRQWVSNLLSQVKHSTTEPLCSRVIYFNYATDGLWPSLLCNK